MKRVKIYKPKITNKVVDKRTVTVVEDYKHEFIIEKGVMDRTLEQFELNKDDSVFRMGIYMEEVVKEATISDDEAPKRTRRSKEQIEADKTTK